MRPYNTYPYFADFVASQRFISGDWVLYPEEGVIYDKHHQPIKGTHNDGYRVISTKWNGQPINIMYHRAVYIGWRGGRVPADELQIDHIDGNRENNRIDNLRLVTDYENKQNPNTRMRRSGISSPHAPEIWEYVHSVLNDWDTGKYTFADLARKYGKTPKSIANIIKGKTYKEFRGERPCRH